MALFNLIGKRIAPEYKEFFERITITWAEISKNCSKLNARESKEIRISLTEKIEREMVYYNNRLYRIGNALLDKSDSVNKEARYKRIEMSKIEMKRAIVELNHLASSVSDFWNYKKNVMLHLRESYKHLKAALAAK